MPSAVFYDHVTRLRQAGLSDKSISVALGMHYGTLRVYASRARRNGYISIPAAEQGYRHIKRAKASLAASMLDGTQLSPNDAAFLIVHGAERREMLPRAKRLVSAGLTTRQAIFWLTELLEDEAELATAA
jgi:hypothetical protein